MNCKNYEEIAGDKIVRFVKMADKVSKKYNVKLMIAPPQHLVSLASKYSGVPILAQHIDNAGVGSTTGYIVPELLKKSRVRGALINHSEHRIPSKDISRLVEKLRELKMVSVLCVKDLTELKKYIQLEPDFVAIEPPELIGSGKAISRENPDIIINAVKIVKKSDNKTKLLCGAGIISGEDVRKALELGSNGILVASGIVKSKNWNKILSDFCKAIKTI